MILPSGADTYSYKATAEDRGWGKGWPNCNAGPGRTVTATRSGTKWYGVHVRIADLVEILVNEIERRGYMFVPGWNWGGSCRPIAGTTRPSNHSWLLAIDMNAPNNSYNSSGQHDIPAWVYGIFRVHGFGVGADYSGSKQDWMHAEFMGTPGDADVMTAIAKRWVLDEPVVSTIAVVVNNGSYPNWSLAPGHHLGPVTGPAFQHSGDPRYDGPEVRATIAEFQKQLASLNYKVGAIDGLWGPATTNATGDWQRRNLGGAESIIVSNLCGLNDFRAIHSYARNVRWVAPYPGSLIKKGSTNKDAVKDVQARLIERGYLPGGTDDGIFGPKTEDAVKRFQYDSGLRDRDVDGVVGPITWGKLH